MPVQPSAHDILNMMTRALEDLSEHLRSGGDNQPSVDHFMFNTVWARVIRYAFPETEIVHFKGRETVKALGDYFQVEEWVAVLGDHVIKTNGVVPLSMFRKDFLKWCNQNHSLYDSKNPNDELAVVQETRIQSVEQLGGTWCILLNERVGVYMKDWEAEQLNKATPQSQSLSSKRRL